MKKLGLALLLSSFFVAQVFAQQPQDPPQGDGGNNNAEAASEFPEPFEATPGELVTEEIDESKLSDDEKRVLRRNLTAEELWKNPDYRNYEGTFAELHKLSKSFANNQYRLSLSAYQAGVNSIIKMRDAVELYKKQEAEKKRLNEKWYWQVVDRKAREQRVVNRMKREAKMEAVTFFTRAINYLDEITNPNLRERPAFKKLLSALYRNWIMYQYDLGNIPQIIPILELYIEVDDNEKEYPAHKYLAQAYAFQENMVKKYGAGTEDQLFRFRYKKNMHLLRAAELKYTKESPEYKHVVNVVNRDEIISVMP